MNALLSAFKGKDAGKDATKDDVKKKRSGSSHEDVDVRQSSNSLSGEEFGYEPPAFHTDVENIDIQEEYGRERCRESC
jgi:hypothetical protein